MNRKRIACIINPVAANNKWIKRKNLKGYLEKNIPGQIYDSQNNKIQTIQLAKKLSLENDILVAAGGDGTVADVIQGIMEANRGKDTALAVLPLGSGNAFRRSFGIPLSMRKAIQLLEYGHTKEIDLIDIEGQPATFASIGATAEITHKKIQTSLPGLRGHLKASLIIFRLPLRKMEVELFEGLDDRGKPFFHKTLHVETLDCVIGKTNYFGYSWKVAPNAKADDGFIDITFYETSPVQYVLSFPRIYLGTFQKTQKHVKAKGAVFRGDNLHIQYHGEHLGIKEKITLNLRPRALTVITP
jgi:diacylglycerol kinase family enzyme